MKRTERHHLKQDEFVHWLDELMMWGLDNKKNIVNGAIVVLGASLLLGGLSIYRSRQAQAAQALLSDALRQFHGVVDSGEGAAPRGNVATFASNDEKYRAALASFETVASEYSRYAEGRQASYYVGLCQASLDELDAADSSLEQVRGGDRDLVYYLASRALASVRSSAGNAPGASEIYRSLIEDADNPLPKDDLLFELGKLEERSGNLDQARQYYDRLSSEHPQSMLSGDASNRSERISLSMEGDADTSD